MNSSASAGVLVAYWSLDAIVALVPPDVPRIEQARVDAGVLGFALGLSLLTGSSPPKWLGTASPGNFRAWWPDIPPG